MLVVVSSSSKNFLVCLTKQLSNLLCICNPCSLSLTLWTKAYLRIMSTETGHEFNTKSMTRKINSICELYTKNITITF